ncbi:hypothetical protein GCM10010988_24530 [Cnuibacter physcomitrellae]|uniref:Uncharacterized protein n=1 Tax=Cnuibacter physcomitrellae TaxID=1619308 RepID=A0A1X9LL10_9MICO|nr:DciA family protein [Cnuibacter physcomitrellae]ARJ03799.1 hypothetical protein B5808_00025 [Cnuibacter physcomitrellae]MCS5497512.1 DciA family protein [Cnuibacter physcomitrellae]GGI39530.1 hypothetical protein GCM10010988_24530 [Cnuibacter physcomitrellae]
MTESQNVYLRLKEALAGAPVRRTRRGIRTREVDDDGTNMPYGRGRDPRPLGDVVDSLSQELGWTASLAKSDIMLDWAEIAGPETAEHSRPMGVTDAVLTIQCDSTAWATQLRTMRSHLLGSIAQRYPDAGIESIRFEAPHAPTWKRGSRSIPGRGPRDTYG